MTAQKMDKMGPVLIGGLVGGIASGIPLLNLLNCCCCLLYVLGGGMAGALFANQGKKIGVYPSIGDGAIVGTLAGVVGGVIAGLIESITAMLFGAGAKEALEFMDQIPDMPPEQREMIERMVELFSGSGGLAVSFLITVAVGTLFGLFGGMIGVAIFRKSPPEAPSSTRPPSVTPPASPPPPPPPSSPSGPAPTGGMS